jgi:hypothetical protein
VRRAYWTDETHDRTFVYEVPDHVADMQALEIGALCICGNGYVAMIDRTRATYQCRTTDGVSGFSNAEHPIAEHVRLEQRADGQREVVEYDVHGSEVARYKPTRERTQVQP